MRIKHAAKQGFTLVEIMVVVAIIGMLAAIAIPTYVRAREQSRTKTCVNSLRQISGAKEQYALETGLGTGGTCDSATIQNYLKRGMPTCPVGDTPYLVNDIGQEPACNSVAKDEHNNAWLNP